MIYEIAPEKKKERGTREKEKRKEDKEKEEKVNFKIAPEERKGKKGGDGKRKGREDRTYVKAKHMKCNG